MLALRSALQRAMIRSERPLRPLWGLAYAAVMRIAAAYLRLRQPESSVYLRASFGYGDSIFGLSDIDLVVALPDHPQGAHACPRVRRRWSRLCRLLPGLDRLVQPTIYERSELRAALARPTLTARQAVHLQPEPPCDEAGFRLRPGLFGPMRDWRHLAGSDDRPSPLPARTAQDRRLAAWLELQRWWREAFFACGYPGGLGRPYTCVKLVAEPARILLWLAHGIALETRRDVLSTAASYLPEERGVFERALELYESLPRLPDPPLGEALSALVLLSSRIAGRIAEELQGTQLTSVRLIWGDASELVIAPHARERLRGLGASEPQLLPLADWRSRAWPSLPDEAVAPLEIDPTEPAALGAAARAAGDWGPFVAIGVEGLMILPGPGLLRAVNCVWSDPVTFALLEGSRTAEFPDVPGWSAQDSARRAVAEHAAWLGMTRSSSGRTLKPLIYAQARTTQPTAQTLGRLFTAARAALFEHGLAAGQPALPLTVAAVAAGIGDYDARASGVAEEACGQYRAAILQGAAIQGRVVERLRERVLELPSFAYETPWPRAPLRTGQAPLADRA